jgi:hypothetical protein
VSYLLTAQTAKASSRPGMTATFVSARRGDLIYRIWTFSTDMGDGEFLAQDKAIFFMRWIRKQLEARD